VRKKSSVHIFESILRSTVSILDEERSGGEERRGGGGE
jgi:hypothetical protein